MLSALKVSRHETRLRLRHHASIAARLLLGAAAVGACQDEAPPRDGVVALSKAPHKEKPKPPNPAIWERPFTDPELERGRQVWVGTCIDCHSTGLGGAPLIGNQTLWAPRIAQGLETLVQHATNGFYGEVGEMPARGGNPELSDEDIRAAVRFMASRADKSIL